MAGHYLPHVLLSTLLISIFIGTAHAQVIAVSSTAAWSSQIVAFWGAILIAVRSSLRGKVTNAFSSLFCSFRVMTRAGQITGSLSRGNWYLQSGWQHGKLRQDIVLISWRSPAELRRLALQVSMQIETIAFNEWEVLVLGKQLRSSSPGEGTAHWIKSPRHSSLGASKDKQSGENVFPLSEADIAEGLASLTKVPVSELVKSLDQKRETRASRCALPSEMYRQLESNQIQHSFAYVFTNVEGAESPYQSLKHWTGQYGSNRGSAMTCASRMYIMVHLTVAAAIGLMGAASGRGLATWLLAVRPTLYTLGAQNIHGDDAVLSLIAMDKSVFQYETSSTSPLLAGDVTCSGLPWWHLAGAFAVPLMEIILVCGGWLYGAIRVEKFQPSGVVGHGMLGLSAVVWIGLSLRAFISLRQRLSGRMVGMWKTSLFSRIVVGARGLELSVDRLLASADYSTSVLSLVATLMRDQSSDTDEAAAILVAECVLRFPGVGTLLDCHIAADIMKFQYQGDSIVLQGEPPRAVKVRDVYSWIQTSCCIALTMLCGCVSVVYAYYSLPSWVKILAEVVLAASGVWFGTIERTSGLPHNRDTYVCFMVATLVASSVWYVGVKDVG